MIDETEDSIIFKIDIGKAIDKLKIEDKTIIMLKYFEDFTITQISEVLACTVGGLTP
ncbi:MAG TPA: sigma factor-like helix-turn-helix DNA-binding protein [Pseudobacteroides sp.]|uniref:sigma factor-like helix-turn-helix DNA-binding protein n=1 Tax=Pseudobacteroides sp. TaxID=1968840 RepID=UPI002F94821B